MEIDAQTIEADHTNMEDAGKNEAGKEEDAGKTEAGKDDASNEIASKGPRKGDKEEACKEAPTVFR